MSLVIDLIGQSNCHVILPGKKTVAVKTAIKRLRNGRDKIKKPLLAGYCKTRKVDAVQQIPCHYAAFNCFIQVQWQSKNKTKLLGAFLPSGFSKC